MRLTVVGAAVLLLSACGGTPSSSPAQDVRLPQASPAQVSATRSNAITAAVARVSPAVVTVQTEAVERVPADYFEQMFGGRSAQRAVAGLGSGFVVRSDGLIITNAHVIAGATRISIAMRDGVTYAGRVLGSDDTNDLAVVKIDASNLPVAPLGSSSGLIIGEWAIAIGNPYGFLLANTEPSVTVGVVSGTGRNLATPPGGVGVYVDMIQTDASVNPGNSGGPLVNAAGEVIGVNSSIFSPSGGSVGLGFAIPINRARRVAEDLIASGKVRRPWIGVKLFVSGAGNPREVLSRGAVVASVTPASPAARAGIRAGDVLLRAGQRTLRNAFDWEAEKLELRVGDRVPIVARRGTSELTFDVAVEDLPEVNAPRVTVLREIQLVTLTPSIRAERGIRSTAGAFVQAVSALASEQIGLQVGDVVLQVNARRITTAEDAASALNTQRGAVVMYVERGGQIFSTEFVTR